MNPCLSDLVCCICGGLAIEPYDGHRKCRAHKDVPGSCGSTPPEREQTPGPVEGSSVDVPFPDVAPNVRDIPQAERDRLDAEADAEGLPF